MRALRHLGRVALRGRSRRVLDCATGTTAVELLCPKRDDLAAMLARHPSIRTSLEEIRLERLVAASQAMSRKE